MKWMEGEWRGCRNRIPVVRWREDLGLSVPSIDADERLYVNCNKCETCQRDKAKDWIGRTIGEAYGADYSYFVTLTIGGRDWFYARGLDDNPRAHIEDKADVQAYVKRLRFWQRKDWKDDLAKRGLDWRKHVPPSLRFFYVGERGERFGRVHYHMLAFYYGSEGPRRVPDGEDIFHGKMDESVSGPYELVDDERLYWPWGWSCWKRAQPSHSWYTANYVNKGAFGSNGAILMRPGISTRPLMGARYFDLLAEDHVRAGLSPQSRTYQAPKNPGYMGKPVSYWMTDAATKRFAESFLRQWEALYKNRDWPHSDMLDQYLDRRARKSGPVIESLQDALFRERVLSRTAASWQSPKWHAWVPGDELLLMTNDEAEALLHRKLRKSDEEPWGF